MASVFISHSSADKTAVRHIAGELALLGITVWIDEAEIDVGESLIAKISGAIEHTDFVAAIISHNSVSSGWVLKELNLAMTKEIEGRRVVVLPVLIDDCVIPFFLRDKLYADLRTNFSEGIARLAKAVNRHSDQPPLPEPACATSGSPHTKTACPKSEASAGQGADSEVGGTPLPPVEGFRVVRAIGKTRELGKALFLAGAALMIFAVLFARAELGSFGLYIILTGACSAMAGTCLTVSFHYTSQAFERDRNLLLIVEQIGGWNCPFGSKWHRQWEAGHSSREYRIALLAETVATLLAIISLLPIMGAMLSLLSN